MPTRRLKSITFALGALLIASFGGSAQAQGITTGAIGGTATDAQGNPLQAAQVQAVNTITGFRSSGVTRENGQFLVTGLEVGGPYRVTVRRIGYQPHTRENIYVQLSQTVRLDVKLEPQVTTLSELEIRATTGEIIAPTNIGTKTTVSQQALERAATTTRNLVDFTRSAPQVSSSGPGFSGGGMSNRMNNVQIDGATERDVFGLGSTGQPGGRDQREGGLDRRGKGVSRSFSRRSTFVRATSAACCSTRSRRAARTSCTARSSSTTAIKIMVVTFRLCERREFNRRQTGFTLGGPDHPGQAALLHRERVDT